MVGLRDGNARLRSMSSYFRPPMWTVPLVVAVMVAGLGWWGNQRLRETVRDDLRSDLSSTLHANVMALEIWTTNQMKLATALAEEPDLRASAMEALQHSQPDGHGTIPLQRGRRKSSAATFGTGWRTWATKSPISSTRIFWSWRHQSAARPGSG